MSKEIKERPFPMGPRGQSGAGAFQAFAGEQLACLPRPLATDPSSGMTCVSLWGQSGARPVPPRLQKKTSLVPSMGAGAAARCAAGMPSDAKTASTCRAVPKSVDVRSLLRQEETLENLFV